MTFIDAVKSVYSKYFTFSGRAVRSEFWWYCLFVFLVSLLISFVEGGWTSEVGPGTAAAFYQGGPIANIWALANLVPSLAVGARRLHDLDKSGWWQLLGLIPLVGIIVLIVWWASRGTQGTNRFGG